MKKRVSLWVPVFALFLGSGCSFPTKTIQIQDSNENAVQEALAKTGRTQPGKMAVFFRDDKIGHPYVELGKVECKTHDLKVDPETLLEDFKGKASEIGANAILLEQAASRKDWEVSVSLFAPGGSFSQRATAILVDGSQQVLASETPGESSKGSNLSKTIPLDQLSFPPKY